jgi:hypothetical protein
VLLGFAIAGTASSLLVWVIPLAQLEIHSTGWSGALCNFESEVAHEQFNEVFSAVVRVFVRDLALATLATIVMV